MSKKTRLLKSLLYGFGIIFCCFAIPMLLGDLTPFQSLWFRLLDFLLQPMWLLDHPIRAIYDYLFPFEKSRPLGESMVAAIIFDAIVCSAFIYIFLYGRDRLKKGPIVPANIEQ